jgi:hypothetical protein
LEPGGFPWESGGCEPEVWGMKINWHRLFGLLLTSTLIEMEPLLLMKIEPLAFKKLKLYK